MQHDTTVIPDPPSKKGDYRPGDVVNGFILTSDNTWREIAAPPKSKVVRGSIAAAKLALVGAACFAVGAALAQQQPEVRPVATEKPAEVAWEDEDDDGDGLLNGQDPMPSEVMPMICTQLETGIPLSVTVDAPTEVKITNMVDVLNHCFDFVDAYKVAVGMSDPDVRHEAAISDAEAYLENRNFSRQRLIDQLTQETETQYPEEIATWAVDQLQIDWKTQAVAEATDYLKYLPGNGDALLNHLIQNGFTVEEATYAVTAVGLPPSKS